MSGAAEERAARNYRAAEEDELLAALKAESAIRSSSYKQDSGGADPPRGSPPSLAAGAFGKYASAVAAERHMSPVAVMASVESPGSRDALPDEDEIRERLQHEAAAACALEKSNSGGAVHRGSMAARLQSAADKFSRMVDMDKAAAQ